MEQVEAVSNVLPTSEMIVPRPQFSSCREKKLTAHDVMKLTKVPKTSAYDTFLRFVDYDDDGNVVGTRRILSTECFETWRRTRTRIPKSPEENFRRALISHLTGSEGRKPFSFQVEKCLLVELRKKKTWECFNENSNVSIGINGFQKMGFHERANMMNGSVNKSTYCSTDSKTHVEKLKRSLIRSTSTSYEVFVKFIKYKKVNNGKVSCNASGILSKACFEEWLANKVCTPSNPEESFRRALVSHLTASDGRKPFPPEVERSILADIRKKVVWPCFLNTKCKIGSRGFQKKGYHEKRDAKSKLINTRQISDQELSSESKDSTHEVIEIPDAGSNTIHQGIEEQYSTDDSDYTSESISVVELDGEELTEHMSNYFEVEAHQSYNYNNAHNFRATNDHEASKCGYDQKNPPMNFNSYPYDEPLIYTETEKKIRRSGVVSVHEEAPTRDRIIKTEADIAVYNAKELIDNICKYLFRDHQVCTKKKRRKNGTLPADTFLIEMLKFYGRDKLLNFFKHHYKRKIDFLSRSVLYTLNANPGNDIRFNREFLFPRVYGFARDKPVGTIVMDEYLMIDYLSEAGANILKENTCNYESNWLMFSGSRVQCAVLLYNMWPVLKVHDESTIIWFRKCVKYRDNTRGVLLMNICSYENGQKLCMNFQDISHQYSQNQYSQLASSPSILF